MYTDFFFFIFVLEPRVCFQEKKSHEIGLKIQPVDFLKNKLTQEVELEPLLDSCFNMAALQFFSSESRFQLGLPMGHGAQKGIPYPYCTCTISIIMITVNSADEDRIVFHPSIHP